MLREVPPGEVVFIAGEPTPRFPYLTYRGDLRMKLPPDMSRTGLNIVIQ